MKLERSAYQTGFCKFVIRDTVNETLDLGVHTTRWPRPSHMMSEPCFSSLQTSGRLGIPIQSLAHTSFQHRQTPHGLQKGNTLLNDQNGYECGDH